MAKHYFSAATQEDFEARYPFAFETTEAYVASYQDKIDDAVSAAVSELLAKQQIELDALNSIHAAEVAKLREANATADYSAYDGFPELRDLLMKTDLRPGALPSLCALRVWQGFTKASDIAKDIGITPKLGTEKGGVPCTAKMAASALQKLEKGLFAANIGLGVKVTALRTKDGDCVVKKIKWVPVTFDDVSGSGDSDSGVEIGSTIETVSDHSGDALAQVAAE